MANRCGVCRIRAHGTCLSKQRPVDAWVLPVFFPPETLLVSQQWQGPRPPPPWWCAVCGRSRMCRYQDTPEDPLKVQPSPRLFSRKKSSIEKTVKAGQSEAIARMNQGLHSGCTGPASCYSHHRIVASGSLTSRKKWNIECEKLRVHHLKVFLCPLL